MISVLAFDLSMRRTGFAYGTPDIVDGKAKPGWGVFEPSVGDDVEHVTMRRFCELLGTLHDKHKFSHIVWEQIFIDHRPNHLQFNGTRAQFNYEGILLGFCGSNNIAASQVPISAWRSHAYGICKAPPDHRVNGKAEDGYWKKMATAWAASYGWYVEHHDSAEALAMMNWALAMLDERYASLSGPLFRRQELNQMYKRGIHKDE
jgi:hypothetical protein